MTFEPYKISAKVRCLTFYAQYHGCIRVSIYKYYTTLLSGVLVFVLIITDEGVQNISKATWPFLLPVNPIEYR